MDALGNGLVTLLNGMLDLIHRLISPVALALAVCAISFAWLCLVQIEEMNRLGTKPLIGRH